MDHNNFLNENYQYLLSINYYFVIGGVFLSYLTYRILHSLFETNYIHTKYNGRGHIWRSIQCNKSIPYNIHCTICDKLMLPIVGLFCDSCAVSACKQCHRLVNRRIKCKSTAWSQQQTFGHHWTTIGFSQGESDDHIEDKTKRYFCTWCQRIKLAEDLTSSTEECDFLKYRNLIIPPKCVEMQKGVVSKINPLPQEDWEPLIIFANRKSGSNRSDEVLSLFRGILNPIQVIDISRQPPHLVVSWLPPKCRVLAAGGDGTVAWVLNALADAPHIKAPVGILPMGTGNDLSRVLGWGPTCGSQLDAHSIIKSLTQATVQPIDRWRITIKPKKRRLGRFGSERVLHAYNYASIGVDAQVALDFHRARTQFLYRYASRTLNYLTYLIMGAGRAIDGGACVGLEQRLKVYLGHTDLVLPPVQALVLLNIPSWGAGVDLWSLGSEEDVGEQSICDGKIEVVGISSSFQIARLQCGLAEPYRFSQASKVKLELDGACAMQVDGEPWMQHAATITMDKVGTSLVLKRTEYN